MCVFYSALYTELATQAYRTLTLWAICSIKHWGIGAAEGAGREPVLPNLARADGPQLPAADRAEQQPGRTHADAPVAALDVHAADVLGDVARQVQAQQQF